MKGKTNLYVASRHLRERGEASSLRDEQSRGPRTQKGNQIGGDQAHSHLDQLLHRTAVLKK